MSLSPGAVKVTAQVFGQVPSLWTLPTTLTMDDSLGTIEEELEQLDLSTDNDSGVDESTQGRPKSARGTAPITGCIRSSSGSSRIPTKSSPVLYTSPGLGPTSQRTRHTPAQPVRRTRSQSTPASVKPRFNLATSSPSTTVRKVSMNKVVVGTAPSPNLNVSQSRIGSLANAHHRPGGGQVRIESRRLDWCNTGPRTNSVREGYTPGGGDIKIEHRKLSWKAESKVGSLEKASHRAGGGEVKIENRKLDWRADSKVGSKNNLKHRAGGGDLQIYSEKVEWRVGSRVGSTKNMKHRAGGGDVKIYDEKVMIQVVDSRVGSTKNMKHRAGGGDVKIHNEKVQFVAGSRVGSTNNIRHRAGGGDVKIHDSRVEFRVGSRIGSLTNVKHRAGGGDKKIFDDKEYLKQSQEGGLHRSGSSSLSSSILGSTSLVEERSQTLKRVKKISSDSHSSNSYQAQVLRKLSPMGVGF